MTDLIKLIIEKAFSLETNITEVEKVENQYKLDRKRTLFAVFLFTLYLTVIIGAAYFFTIKYEEKMLSIGFITLLIMFVVAWALDKTKYVDLISVVIIQIYVPFFFNSIAILAIFIHFRYEYLIFFGIVISLMFVLYYTMYELIKEALTMRKEHTMTIVLSDSKELNIKLLSITKRGDYIVRFPEDENTEILINRDEIQKIIYKKQVNVKEG
ncbi:hypothetical protein [Bacillus sp. SM2101]|uniref:hypothetical protein n=1 Tax=Bacillus sp. SM2101 TaxID=2805366 RepID=UPI001BDE71E1|nr:hypothetical protein [Bacillus sp. SM2101]